MADENNIKEGSGLNRRNFLKNAGVAVAAGTLGTGLTLTPDAAAAAATQAGPSTSGKSHPITNKVAQSGPQR